MSEVNGPSDLHRISKENVVSVGVSMADDPLKAGVARHRSEDTHILGPAMPKGVLAAHKGLVAEPFVDGFVEEEHACVHVNPALVVKYLMPHHIGHRRHF